MSKAAKKRNSSQSKPRLRAWLKILKVSNLIEKDIRERLREQHETTLPRFDVMSALSRSEHGLKMSELSGVLKVSNGNVTGIVDRLVQDALVIRSAVEGDRRANRVRLTRKGQTQFDIYAAEHEAWVDDLLGDLTAKDAEVLTELLALVSRRVNEQGTDDA